MSDIKSTKPSNHVISGEAYHWTLFGNTRRFATVTVPFSEASQIFMAVPYNAITGKGEQRGLNQTHVKKMRREIERGSYTPTPISAGLRKKHVENLVFKTEATEHLVTNEKIGTFELDVDYDDPLPLTDGGHRMEAIGDIRKSVVNAIKQTPTESTEERKKLSKVLESIDDLPIVATIYFNGDPQLDFINFQAGRSVDAAHMLSIKIQSRLTSEPAMKLAWDVARLLAKNDNSPFKGLIRFDSRSKNALPISTLCARGKSDIATSLVGLAMVGLSAEKSMDATLLAHYVTAAFSSIEKYHPEVLEPNKVLTPMINGEGATKGSSVMLLGVATCLAQRMILLGHHFPSGEDLRELAAAVKETLDKPVDGNFSGPFKRSLLGEFATHYFHDLNDPKVEFHHGLPLGLVTTLSCSSFNCEALPKTPKVRVKKGKKTSNVEAPPVIVTNAPVNVSDVLAPFVAGVPFTSTVAALEKSKKVVLSPPMAPLLPPLMLPTSLPSVAESVPWDEEESEDLENSCVELQG